jgi:hypothetical protein
MNLKTIRQLDKIFPPDIVDIISDYLYFDKFMENADIHYLELDGKTLSKIMAKELSDEEVGRFRDEYLSGGKSSIDLTI